MKNTFRTLTLASLPLVLAGAIACEEIAPDAEVNTPTTIDDTSHLVPPRYLSLGALTKWFEEEYSINFIYEQLDERGYMQVSEGVPLPYTPATDSSRIKRLLYYIGDYVLNVFPTRTVAKYMPPIIYIVDSLKETYEVWDDQTVLGKTDRSSSFFPVTGQTTGDYLVLGNAGPRFDDKKEGLREELLSLFIDRLSYNTNLPQLDDFKKITETATLASGTVWELVLSGTSVVAKMTMNYPYWDGLAKSGSASSSIERSSGADWSSYDSAVQTPWLGRGIRKVGRSGRVYYEYRNISGTIINTYQYVKATVRQDFADFAVFVITTPAAKREAFYAQVAANKNCGYATISQDMRSGVKPIPDYFKQLYLPLDTGWYDTRFPYAGTLGADAMRQKDAYVQKYFKEKLNVELRKEE
ncbi:MAG: hypothetical protein LBS63_05860 [Prevotellaceae bacterium]|jgi:hypothetical protein|nr:hypothetical protein [Prevotellaceae bacterium]